MAIADRDITRGSKLIPEEHERRRAIFWELLSMDSRMVNLLYLHRELKNRTKSNFYLFLWVLVDTLYATYSGPFPLSHAS